MSENKTIFCSSYREPCLFSQLNFLCTMLPFQLTQTLRDLLLMIPYLPAILIPFLEFLIPPMVALTGIAPSAFIRKEKKVGFVSSVQGPLSTVKS